jgi:hypothetical protein
MSAKDRIEINPKVMLGKPVIRGTRITVERNHAARQAKRGCGLDYLTTSVLAKQTRNS